VGKYFTLTPAGAYTEQRLGGGDFDSSSVVPKNLRNGRAVGWADVYTTNTSIRTERALGWDLANPGTAYELGHAAVPGVATTLGVLGTRLRPQSSSGPSSRCTGPSTARPFSRRVRPANGRCWL